MLVDSHCHLADTGFSAELDTIVSRAQAAGVDGALCIISSDTEEELIRAPVVARAWPSVLFATAIHPHRAGSYAGRATVAAALVQTAVERLPAVVLGEMGLDYHYDFAPREVQHEVFAAQVDLAVRLNLPVAIHTREATDDTHAILRSAGGGQVRGVMHCFTGSADDARRALELDFYLSVPGIVTFPRAGALRDVLRLVPADRLLVETDAPYLAPVPHRGKRNEPAFLAETVRVLAEVRGVSIEALAEQLHANFDRFVGRSRVDTPVNPVV
jgi:TatD DNase family protein